MGYSEFKKIYHDLITIPLNNEIVMKKFNKSELVAKLFSAIEALKFADEIIMIEADKVFENAKVFKNMLDSDATLNPDRKKPTDKISYSAALKKPQPIIVKPLDAYRGPGTQIKSKVAEALQSVRVDNSHVTNAGTMFIEVHSEQEHQEAVSKVAAALKDSHTVEDPKQKSLKLVISKVPDNIPDKSLIAAMCAKDKYVANKYANGELFTIEKSWKTKSDHEKTERNVVIKCTRAIREHYIDSNNGYVFLGLTRYKVQDFVDPKQCFHCQKFYHFAANCASKDKPPVCGLCGDSHETKSCRHNENSAFRCCANCRKTGEDDPYHSARSSICPYFLKTKKEILQRLLI